MISFNKILLNEFFLSLLKIINPKPIKDGKAPSFIINQFFDNPNLSPKIPIPPVNKTLINPKIEITFTFFLLKKS